MTDDELKTMLDAATRGPWQAAGFGVMACGSVDTYAGSVLGRIATAERLTDSDSEGRGWSTGGCRNANARLISLAPALAAEVLELRQKLREATNGST